jgi:hypothetical protein
MASCYRQGRGQDDPQSEENDQPESNHALVAFASELVRVGLEIPVFRKDASHRVVAPSVEEFLKK